MAPCNNPDTVELSRRKKDFNRGEVNDTIKRNTQLRRILDMVSVPSRDAQGEAVKTISKATELDDANFAMLTAEMVNLRPQQRDAIGGLFASMLGEKIRGVLDPTLTRSTAGEVRNVMLETKRLAEGTLDFVAKHKYVQQVDEAISSFKEVMKRRGITDRAAIQEALLDTIEIGQLPKLRQTYGEGVDAVDQVLNHRYNQYVSRMQAIGLEPVDIENMVRASEDISSVFDEERLIALAQGVDVGDVRQGLMGYFPRIATDDFKLRMNDIKEEPELFAQLKSGQMPMSTVFNRSRKTYHYIPADDQIVATLVGKTPTEVRDMLNNPTEWRRFLHDNISTDQLDTLVDTGVFHKLPMTSKEVFDYMVRQYELPYKGLNEMFILDPQAAIERYAMGLHQSVANHAIFNKVAFDGLKAGWSVLPEQVAADPQTYKGFVRLKDVDSKFLSKLDGQELDKLGEVYVHPIVADQWKGVVDLASNPAHMSQAAHAWHYISSAFNTGVLLSQGVMYPGRVFLSNLIAGVGGGMNPMYLLPSWLDTVRSMKGLEFLDDTKKVFQFGDGTAYTKREMYERLLKHRNVKVAPLTGGQQLPIVQWEALNPKNLPGALRYLWDYTNSFGTPWSGERFKRFGTYASEQLYKQLRESFAPIANFTQMMEFGFKWATLQSMPKAFNTFDDALKHIDNYFYMFDDPGKFGGMYGRYVQPFSGYMMQNTPSMLRFMLKSPQKVVAYQRLLQLYNAETVDPQNPPPEAGFRSDDLNKYPIALQKDPNTGAYITLLPTNYDPILDAFMFVTGTADAAKHLFLGHYTGTSEEQRKQATGGAGWQKVLSDVLQGSYWESPVQILTGYDPFTGEIAKDSLTRPTSFLGVRMSPLAKALISSVPPLDMLNRANPGGMFGLREVRDARNNVLRKAQPSIMEQANLPFAGERSDADTRIGDAASKNQVYNAMRFLGMNVKTIDVAKNMQSSYADIKNASSEIRGGIAVAQKSLKARQMEGSITPEQYAKAEAEINKAVDTWLQLEWDLGRVRLWMAQNRVPEKEVFSKMRDQGIATSSLPMPGAKKTRELLDEAARIRQGAK